MSDGDRLTYFGQGGGARGWAGPVEADAPAWAAPVFAFELELADALKPVKPFADLPDQPAIERDLALILPDGVSSAQVDEVIRKRGGGYLESSAVFDEYRGDDINGRSVAWRMVFRAREKTLRDRDVDGAVDKVLKALREQLGVERR